MTMQSPARICRRSPWMRAGLQAICAVASPGTRPGVAGFGVLLWSLARVDRLPPPPLTADSCIDEKFKFLAEHDIGDVDFIAVGSSVTWRNLDMSAFRHKGLAQRPLNAAPCYLHIGETAYYTEFLLGHMKKVEDRFVSVVSPRDFEQCSGPKEPFFSATLANAYVFDGLSSFPIYLDEFPAGRLLQADLQIKGMRTDPDYYFTMMMDEYGSGPLHKRCTGCPSHVAEHVLLALTELEKMVNTAGRHLVVPTFPFSRIGGPGTIPVETRRSFEARIHAALKVPSTLFLRGSEMASRLAVTCRQPSTICGRAPSNIPRSSPSRWRRSGSIPRIPDELADAPLLGSVHNCSQQEVGRSNQDRRGETAPYALDKLTPSSSTLTILPELTRPASRTNARCLPCRAPNAPGNFPRKIGTRILDGSPFVRHVFTGRHGAAAFGCSVQSEAGHRLRVVVDRLGQGDTFPHVPIHAVNKRRSEAAKLLVGRPTNHDGDELDSLVQKLPCGKVDVENTGGTSLQLRQTGPLTVLIHVNRPAECRADVGMICNALADAAIEALSHGVVTVEDMDPMAAGPLYAGVEILDYAEVLRLTMEVNASRADRANSGFRIADRGAVVDHLDLHLVDAGILDGERFATSHGDSLRGSCIWGSSPTKKAGLVLWAIDQCRAVGGQ